MKIKAISQKLCAESDFIQCFLVHFLPKRAAKFFIILIAFVIYFYKYFKCELNTMIVNLKTLLNDNAIENKNYLLTYLTTYLRYETPFCLLTLLSNCYTFSLYSMA